MGSNNQSHHNILFILLKPSTEALATFVRGVSVSVESLSFSSDRVIVLVTDPNHPGRSPTVTLGMITEKKTTLIATKIMEYLRFKKKSICSRTIHLKYSTSWLYRARLDLVRVFHLFKLHIS